MEYTNVNYATLAPHVYEDLRRYGAPSGSRNGPVLRLPGVTTFRVTDPAQRVNFSPLRDANPFFHLIEAMAMLGNVNSVKLLSYFAANMANFSDNGDTYNAFYGTRLRRRFGFDQLDRIITELRDNPGSRQCVAQIWDPEDLRRPTKDKACNLCLIFDVTTEGKLNMTSFNRSNDAIWGIVTGANVVHLSLFHEYVACSLGIRMGSWFHSTANLHVYTENPQWEKLKNMTDLDVWDLYNVEEAIAHSEPCVSPVPLFDSPEARVEFDAGLSLVLGVGVAMTMGQLAPTSRFEDILGPVEFIRLPPFLRDTVVPVFEAWSLRKHRQPEAAFHRLNSVRSTDWQAACRNWMTRR